MVRQKNDEITMEQKPSFKNVNKNDVHKDKQKKGHFEGHIMRKTG